MRRHGDAHVLDGEVAARIAHRLTCPEPLDDLEALREPAHTRARILSQGTILGVAVAEPHAEDEAAPRDHVEGGKLLRDVDRMVQGKQEEAGAQGHGAAHGGESEGDGDGWK